MYTEFCDVCYDMLMEDPVTHEDHMDFVKAFVNPKMMHEAFRCGPVPVIASSLMEEMERCLSATIPFVLIIRKNGDVWATISCDEILF